MQTSAIDLKLQHKAENSLSSHRIENGRYHPIFKKNGAIGVIGLIAAAPADVLYVQLTRRR